MNVFVDCPQCGSEFIVDENILSSTLRCPDCLQWVNSYDNEGPAEKIYASSYGGRSEYWDDYGFEAGYDY